MGVVIAPVDGSGSCPAWMASVAKPIFPPKRIFSSASPEHSKSVRRVTGVCLFLATILLLQEGFVLQSPDLSLRFLSLKSRQARQSLNINILVDGVSIAAESAMNFGLHLVNLDFLIQACRREFDSFECLERRLQVLHLECVLGQQQARLGGGGPLIGQWCLGKNLDSVCNGALLVDGDCLFADHIRLLIGNQDRRMSWNGCRSSAEQISARY